MDEDFRKPYEYKEYRRGLITLFIVMILVMDIMQTLSFATLENKYLGNMPVLGIIFWIMGILYIIYIIYTAVIVYKLKDNFVASAKRYIVIRSVYSVCNYLIIFFNIIKTESLVGDSTDQYSTYGKMIVEELVIPLFYILSFSIVWFLYFTFSKRCKNWKKIKDQYDIDDE